MSDATKPVEQAWVAFAKWAGYSIHDQAAYIAFEGGWDAREPQGEPSDAQVNEVATAIYNVPAPPGAERENNLLWDEAKWYARTAILAAKVCDE